MVEGRAVAKLGWVGLGWVGVNRLRQSVTQVVAQDGCATVHPRWVVLDVRSKRGTRRLRTATTTMLVLEGEGRGEKRNNNIQLGFGLGLGWAGLGWAAAEGREGEMLVCIFRSGERVPK